MRSRRQIPWYYFLGVKRNINVAFEDVDVGSRLLNIFW